MEIAGGSPSSVPPAMYYDVPIVSARSALLPHIMKHPEYMKDLFYQERNPVAQHRMDPVSPPQLPGLRVTMFILQIGPQKHMNELGHELISDAVIALLEEQDCQTARSDLAPDLWLAEHDVRWPEIYSRWSMPRVSARFDHFRFVGDTKVLKLSSVASDRSMVARQSLSQPITQMLFGPFCYFTPRTGREQRFRHCRHQRQEILDGRGSRQGDSIQVCLCRW